MNLFTRLFGRPDNGVREMDFIGAQRMVLDYARYLEGASPMPGQVLDASCLPHDKELLRDALLFCISNSSDPRLEEHLKAGFLMLSAFQHGVGEAGAGVEFATGPGCGYAGYGAPPGNATGAIAALEPHSRA